MASSQCYIKLNNTIVANNWKTCGKTSSSTLYLQCCAEGDYCLSNGLCRYSHSEVGASGYYAGGCDSKDYNDASCPQLCNAQGKKDVVYASKEKIWSCCGGATNSSTHCDTPTNDNFGAPALNQLTTIYQAGIGTLSSTPSSPQNQNRPGSPSPMPPPPTTVPTNTTESTTTTTTTKPRVVIITKTPLPLSNSPKVSAGLAGGLGAGAAFLVLLVSGMLFYLFRRKRKSREKNSPYATMAGDGEQAGGDVVFASPTTTGAMPGAYRYVAPSEMATKSVRHEMSQEEMVAELEAGAKGRDLEGVDGIQEIGGGGFGGREVGGKG